MKLYKIGWIDWSTSETIFENVMADSGKKALKGLNKKHAPSLVDFVSIVELKKEDWFLYVINEGGEYVKIFYDINSL